MSMRLKRTLERGLAVLGGLVLIWTTVAAVSFYVRRETLPDRFLIVLHLSGDLVEQPSDDPAARFLRGSPPTLRDLCAALDRAADDPRVLGLVARVGDLRMGFGHLQEIRDAVARFRRSGKPTAAFADTFGEFGAGNGAYYLAAAFEEISMQPSGDVGLTGLSARTRFVRGTLDKLGIVPRLDSRSEYKTFKNVFTETGYTEAHRESLGRVLDSLFGRMVEDIALARRMDPGALRKRMDRAPLSARAALDAGLLDRLAYWDEIEEGFRERLGASPRIVDFARYRRRAGRSKAKGPEIALIHVEGEIRRGRNGYNPLTGKAIVGAESIAETIRGAVADERIRGILLRIDSPGGSYIGSDTIWREVVRSESLGKPVVVSMGDVAASGGYFIAAPAHRIVARPGTLTGSIGVFAGKFVTREFWNRLGVTFDEMHTSENGDLWSPSKDFDPEQWRRFQEWLDRAYDDFVGKVARGRGLSVERVREIAKGRVWTGEDALALGLVDALGGYDTALSLLKEAVGIEPEAPARVRPFPPRKTFLRELLDGLNAVGPAAEQTLAPLRPMFRTLETVTGAAGDPRLRTPAEAIPGSEDGFR